MDQTDNEAMVDDCEFKGTGSQSLLFRLVSKNDWSAVGEVDGFLHIFDHLPRKMKIIVDLKMSDIPDCDVAMMLGIRMKTLQNTLTQAKKRFMKAIM